jgi:hypothetical protein
MTRRWRHVAALAGSGVLALGLGACGGGDDDEGASAGADPTPAASAPEPSQPVTGGSTTLRLDRSAAAVFDAVGVDIAPLGEATLEDGRFRFPISGGRVDVDTLSGRIEHAGGLRFRAAGQTLDARDLVIRPGDKVLTAEIAGERLPLLGVDLGAFTAPTSDRLVLPGRAAALSTDVLPALEDELGVDLPGTDVRIGRLDVSAET